MSSRLTIAHTVQADFGQWWIGSPRDSALKKNTGCYYTRHKRTPIPHQDTTDAKEDEEIEEVDNCQSKVDNHQMVDSDAMGIESIACVESSTDESFALPARFTRSAVGTSLLIVAPGSPTSRDPST